jgi:hypothetical protein
MSSKVVTRFVDTVLATFPPFRWEDEQEQTWIATAVRRLSAFPDNVLEKALDHIVGTRGNHKTPLIAELLDACHEARRLINHDTGKSELPIAEPQGHGDWTADRLKLADSLVMTPLGREAAKDGWIGSLHAFCQRNMRAPLGPEIAACKREAKEFDQAYEICVRGGWGQANELEKLGAKMLGKRQQLIDMVLHGVVR